VSRFLKNNKYFVIIIIATIILGGSTFNNLPGSKTIRNIQTINGITYDSTDYSTLNHEQLALFNYISNLITSVPINYFDNWQAVGSFLGFLHYLFAFTEYTMASIFEATPGYRTSYYRDPAYKLIKKMNTTISEYGNESIEYIEWGRTSYPNYYWPNATDPSDLYVGGFRGPANIMWTGHYALMETMYERSFNTGEFFNEISWFINDWNNSLTTDSNNTLKDGGIWGVGLIPCEPYIVFAQCNSIAIYCTELYDNLFGTDYMGMWDYGLNFINTVMHEEYDLTIDGYYIQEPVYGNYTEQPYLTIPGSALEPGFTDGRAKVSSYGTSWALTFLEYTQPEKTIADYPLFLKKYSVDITGEQMYMSITFNRPGEFESVFDMLGTFFGCILAKQRGDFNTLERLQNFLYSSYNKVWSANGREMYYDASSLLEFLTPVLSVLRILITTPNTIRNLADPRPAEFWNYPYISQADDENIWVYQAQWDSEKYAFILNVRVDDEANLSFSNFDHKPIAYHKGLPLAEFTLNVSEYVLTLEPGVYNLVII